MSGALNVGDLYFQLGIEDQKLKTGLRDASTSLTRFAGKASRELKDVGGAGSHIGRGVDTGVRSATRDLDRLQRHAKTTATSMRASFKAMATAGAFALGTGAIVGAMALKNLAVDSVTAASDMQQAAGALDSVFKDRLSPSLKKWAEQQAVIGMSTTEASNALAYMGGMLKGSGMKVDEAAQKSKKLVALGADLAATYGGTTKDAVDAIGSALRGEFDPMERYATSIKQSTINAKAMKMGLWDGKGALDAAAQSQAAYALIMEKTADAQGQSRRESGSYASQLQKMRAQWINLKATAGAALMPIATKYMKQLNAAFPDLAAKVKENVPKVQAFVEKMMAAIERNWPTIKKAFGDVLKVAKTAGSVVAGAYKAFSSLPPGTQDAILKVGSLAAALGFISKTSAGTGIKIGVDVATSILQKLKAMTVTAGVVYVNGAAGGVPGVPGSSGKPGPASRAWEVTKKAGPWAAGIASSLSSTLALPITLTAGGIAAGFKGLSNNADAIDRGANLNWTGGMYGSSPQYGWPSKAKPRTNDMGLYNRARQGSQAHKVLKDLAAAEGVFAQKVDKSERATGKATRGLHGVTGSARGAGTAVGRTGSKAYETVAHWNALTRAIKRATKAYDDFEVLKAARAAEATRPTFGSSSPNAVDHRTAAPSTNQAKGITIHNMSVKALDAHSFANLATQRAGYSALRGG